MNNIYNLEMIISIQSKGLLCIINRIFSSFVRPVLICAYLCRVLHIHQNKISIDFDHHHQGFQKVCLLVIRGRINKDSAN